jgi:hypothetical protein
MATPNSPNRMPKVAEIIFKAQLIDDMQLKAALRAWDQWGGRFTKVMGDMKFSSEEKVVHALAAALRLPPIDLAKVAPDSAALGRLDAATCQAKGIYPCILKDQGKTLWLAMADPTDYETVANLEQKVRVRVKLLVAGEAAIKKAIMLGYNLGGVPERGLTLEHQVETTGEYMDASGEVVGPMKRSVTNPGTKPAAVNALPPRPATPAPRRPPPPPQATWTTSSACPRRSSPRTSCGAWTSWRRSSSSA